MPIFCTPFVRSIKATSKAPQTLSMQDLLTLILLVLGLHLFVLVEVAEAADCSKLDYSAKRNCEKTNALVEKTMKKNPPKIFEKLPATKPIAGNKVVDTKPKEVVDNYAKYSNDAMGISFKYLKYLTPTLANNLEMIPGSSANKPDAGRLVVSFLGYPDTYGKRPFVGLQIEMTLHPNNLTTDDLDTDFLKLFNWDVRTNKQGTYTYYIPNMSPVIHGAQTVGAYTGKRYAFTSEKNNVKYSLTQVSVPVGKRLYRFYAVTDPKNDNTAVIDALLQTVEFREPTFTKSITEKAKSSSSARPTTNRRYK